MRIVFSNEFSKTIDHPFAVYDYDESLIQNPWYIDVRGVVSQKADQWLTDIQQSHTNVSQFFLGFSKWWWVTKASRLDARPWGQEELFKPLFFARAIYNWIEQNPDAEKITLFGCHPWTAIFLNEFNVKQKISFSTQGDVAQFWVSVIWQNLRYWLAALVDFVRMLISHVVSGAGQSSISAENLVLYELLPDGDIQTGHRYYFGSLFDVIQQQNKNAIAIGCITGFFHRLNNLREKISAARNTVLVLDRLSILDCLEALGHTMLLGVANLAFLLKGLVCRIDGKKSRLFWPFYMSHEFIQGSALRRICLYYAIRRLIRQAKARQVIYPYEEKEIERAILYACQDCGVKAVGYTPHPQHRFELALKDFPSPAAPKPERYAVCGEAYASYFRDYCRKDPSRIEVWGSGKGTNGAVHELRRLNQADLSILVVISHPKELDVFGSWLRAENQLTQNKHYQIRLYRAVDYKSQLAKLEVMQKQFNFVEEATGELVDNINQSDLVLFSGTSAGLLAVRHGRLAIHVFLGDFFQINPCFDQIEPMLYCSSAQQLIVQLDKLSALSGRDLTELHNGQKALVNQIFSEPQPERIIKTLCSVN